jgi:hypothetical protein
MQTIEDHLGQIATTYSAQRDKYKSIPGLYTRAAVIASQTLGRQISEHEIAMIEMAMTQAQIALAPHDHDGYSRLAVIASIASKYANAPPKDNYGLANKADLISELEEIASARAMASKLGPASPDTPA